MPRNNQCRLCIFFSSLILCKSLEFLRLNKKARKKQQQSFFACVCYALFGLYFCFVLCVLLCSCCFWFISGLSNICILFGAISVLNNFSFQKPFLAFFIFGFELNILAHVTFDWLWWGELKQQLLPCTTTIFCI